MTRSARRRIRDGLPWSVGPLIGLCAVGLAVARRPVIKMLANPVAIPIGPGPLAARAPAARTPFVVTPAEIDPRFVVPNSAEIDPKIVVPKSAEIDAGIDPANRVTPLRSK